MTAFVVQVDEGKVEASRQGVEWWHLFAARYRPTGRLVETKPPCVVGGTVEVACDDREHADWLAAHMVDHGGLPRTAVRAKVAAGGAVA